MIDSFLRDIAARHAEGIHRIGLEYWAARAYCLLMGNSPHHVLSPPPDAEAELAPPDTLPHIAVAPGILGRPLTVIREQDDTDETYQRRCELLAALLEYAANQD